MWEPFSHSRQRSNGGARTHLPASATDLSDAGSEHRIFAFGEDPGNVPNLMRGAWLVETLIVALVLLLVGKSFGIAITLTAFGAAALLAIVIRLGVAFLRQLCGSRN